MRSRIVTICGHFATGQAKFDGQTVKTRSVYEQIVREYGKDNVEIIDTNGWQKHPIKIYKQCLRLMKKSRNIIVIPARRGVRVFIPLFTFFKDRRGFKLHYVVVGGWLFDLVKNNVFMCNRLKKVDNIYVENKRTINQFKSLGFNNLEYMPNFKNLKASLHKKKKNSDIFNCCIFSRIEKEKGIIDAINVVDRYNNLYSDKIILDIYGKIKDNFKDEFLGAILKNDYIKYKGVVDPGKSVQIIEKYDLLLFPTRYKTEGVPGTIIDAYFSGTPVLASKWDNFDEVIIEGDTGFGYKYGNMDDFYHQLENVAANRGLLETMGKKCLSKSKEYLPKNATRVLINNLKDKNEKA